MTLQTMMMMKRINHPTMAIVVFKLLAIAVHWQLVCCVLPAIKLRTPTGGKEEHIVFPDVRTFAGGRSELPCDISKPSPDDNITLILWYRDNSNGSIYSVDARSTDGSLTRAQHQATGVLANRASFDVSVRPALLRIDPVADDDGMEYRCRVDFKWGRTVMSFVTLNVFVPPKRILIKNENSLPQYGLIGPYNEGAEVKLTCESNGKPPPVVRWLRDNKTIDESFQVSLDNNTVYNDLVISRLSRQDLNAVFTCDANNNLSKPLSASVSIDINLKPIDVQISARHSLRTGAMVEVECKSTGSRPPASITWYKNDGHKEAKLTSSKEFFADQGNKTISLVQFVPSVADNGAYLSCRASNLKLDNSTIEDGWKLNVHFKPNVSLTSKSASIYKDVINLNEGEELILECNVIANPQAESIHFTHEDVQLTTDTKKGIIINNSTLVITRTRPIHRGRFRCFAINSEGKGYSREIRLKINYAPICRHPTESEIIFIRPGEPLKLTCSVDAQPDDVSFYWQFNKTQVDEKSYTNDGNSSTVVYIPQIPDGSLTCWAKNVAGNMKQPCLFQLVSAGPPDPVDECKTINKSTSSVVIDCQPGRDGGLEQVFHLELYDSRKENIFLNRTFQEPTFNLHELSSAKEYRARIFASNSKGRSKSVELNLTTLIMQTNKLSSEPEQSMFEVLIGAVAGLLLILLLLSVIMIVICRIRTRDDRVKNRRDQEPDTIDPQCASVFLLPKGESVSNFDSARNPDLIPDMTDTFISSETSSLQTQLNHSSTLPHANGFIPNHLHHNQQQQPQHHLRPDNHCTTLPRGAGGDRHSIFVTHQSRGLANHVSRDDHLQDQQQMRMFTHPESNKKFDTQLQTHQNYPMSTAV